MLFDSEKRVNPRTAAQNIHYSIKIDIRKCKAICLTASASLRLNRSGDCIETSAAECEEMERRREEILRARSAIMFAGRTAGEGSRSDELPGRKMTVVFPGESAEN